MGLEVQLEDVVLVDVLRLAGHRDGVAQQGKAGQGVVVLRRGGRVPPSVLNHSSLRQRRPQRSRLAWLQLVCKLILSVSKDYPLGWTVWF